MRSFLAVFQRDADVFVHELARATKIWDDYSKAAVSKGPDADQHLAWSAAYFVNGLSAALVSTRQFLGGYLASSGNQARHSVESLSFGVLLAFPATGTYRQFEKGHAIEYRAPMRLVKHAKLCGVDKESASRLLEQAKWFDHYSHASRMSLAAIWDHTGSGGFNIGAVYSETYMDQYRKEMTNRVSLARLFSNAIAGTHAQLRLIGDL